MQESIYPQNLPKVIKIEKLLREIAASGDIIALDTVQSVLNLNRKM